MNNQIFKKLNQDFVEKLEKTFSKKEYLPISELNEKQAKENGTFKFIISTEAQDRSGEAIKVNGWELERFQKNPIVLWSHSYDDLPIGKAISLTKDVENGKLIAEGIFASHQKAQDIRRLYEEKILTATSVGFIPKEYDQENNKIITKAELLEFSIVPVPCNPEALSELSENLGQKKMIEMLSNKEIKIADFVNEDKENVKKENLEQTEDQKQEKNKNIFKEKLSQIQNTLSIILERLEKQNPILEDKINSDEKYLELKKAFQGIDKFVGDILHKHKQKIIN
jgi:HK97 family phage prohead protease